MCWLIQAVNNPNNAAASPPGQALQVETRISSVCRGCPVLLSAST